VKKVVLVVILVACMPAGLSGQVRGRRPPPRLEAQARPNRAALERQILQRFVEQSGTEIGLSGPTKTRLQQILNESNARRRQINQEGIALRQRLMDAIRNPQTSDDEFASILGEIDGLREREHELWRSDQEALSRELTPRQRALFTARWLRFQENIRDLIDRRQGADTSGLGVGAPGALPGGAADVFSTGRPRSER
jgi:hypothetical protein